MKADTASWTKDEGAGSDYTEIPAHRKYTTCNLIIFKNL